MHCRGSPAGEILHGALEDLDKELQIFYSQFGVDLNALVSFTLSMIPPKGSISVLLLGFMPSTTSPYIWTKRR